MQPMRYSHQGQAAHAPPTRRLQPFPPAPKSVRVVSVLDEARSSSEPSTQPLKSSLGDPVSGIPRACLLVLGFVLLGVLVALAMTAAGIRNHLGE
jgi:hypothetical protein